MYRLYLYRLYNLFVCVALFALMIGLIIFPQECVSAAKDGVALCANVIIPSLFPFFVLSTLMISLGIADRLGRAAEHIMRPLFNVNGTCAAAWILGFVGGYPVGAKTAIGLYQSGKCTKAEAERLLSFCNNSGPAFIFGVVGAGIFASNRIGLVLYFAHTAASVLTGILFRNWKRSPISSSRRSTQPIRAVRFTAAFTDAVKNSFSATLGICGFVIFFTVFIKLLFLSGLLPTIASGIGMLLSPVGLDAESAEKLLTGAIEVSSGVWSLKDASGSLSGIIAMAAFMLGWAGLSVHCQVLSFVADSGLSVRTYIFGKFLHGILSAVFIFFVARWFTLDVPVAAYLAEQITSFTSLSFHSALVISISSVLVLTLIFFMFLLVFSRKTCGKKRRIDV